MKKIIISGGGTGGHIFPAIAIAKAIAAALPESEILFVGAKNRMEMEKVPAAGYPIKGLWISGLQRSFSIQNFLFPVKVINSLWNARKIIRQFKPNIAIGVGGYASGPLLYAAADAKVSCLIQEQNSYPGITNKILAAKVQKICVAYQNMEKFFPTEKLVLTGNPVRPEIASLHNIVKTEDLYAKWQLTKQKPVVLLIGGSLGARSLNNAIAEQIAHWQNSDLQLIWQTGKYYYEQYKHHASKNIHPMPFITDMNEAYALSDVVISRAGALSISELQVAQKAAILVPSPNVAEDHQTKNAQALVQNNAAEWIKDDVVNEQLFEKVQTLITDTQKRQLLEENIAKMAKPHAAQQIVQIALELAS
ncbi:MAG: undecaprenyldiphospho-muramoylpentapeptide beta-N-acetylglucosaminyltransferase [Chitinophagales bacterium]|nr:undecaprenyldiphospho-muramoylpentapeptide beta-N-acetylglucosaminyltransferase [Bacteroidota bacterium]